MPHKPDTKVPIHGVEDNETGEEEPDEPTQMADDEDHEDMISFAFPKFKTRISNVMEEIVAKFGATSKCKNCTAPNQFEKYHLHIRKRAEIASLRVMSKTLEDGDCESKVQIANEKSWRENVNEIGFPHCIAETDRLGTIHLRTNLDVREKKQIRPLLDVTFGGDLDKLAWEHTRDGIRKKDVENNALEKCSRKMLT